MTRFYARMQQRRGTAAEWTAANPVLQAGELGYETDTEKFKIGNGTSNWNDLDYWEGSLPDQVGNSGKFLSTDGTDALWAEVDALPDQAGNAGYYLKTDGTTATWDELSIDDIVTVNVGDLGDVTITGTPAEGEALLYDPVSSEWVNSVIEAGANVSTSTTAPSVDVENGDLWWNSEDGALYVYFEDYDSDGYWVEATAGTISFQSIADMTDTNISVPADGEALIYDGASSKWVNEALDALPDQSGSSGYYLTTDGSDASWAELDVPAGTTISGTAPSSPEAGDLWWNSDTGILYIYYNDGSSSQWVSASDGQATISDTAPTGYNGQIWWNSDEGKMYVFYDDGTSSAWVAAGGPQVTVQATAPTGYEGQMWLDSTDGSMYVYYTDPGGGSSSWIGAVSRSGGILQVVSTTKTNVFSTTSTSMVDVTGLSATITPRSTSSKIFVIASFVGANNSSTGSVQFNLVRNSTDIAKSTGSAVENSTLEMFTNSTGAGDSNSITFLDSPSTTSSTTYKIQMRIPYGGTGYVGRIAAGDQGSSSTITLIEVAG